MLVINIFLFKRRYQFEITTENIVLSGTNTAASSRWPNESKSWPKANVVLLEKSESSKPHTESERSTSAKGHQRGFEKSSADLKGSATPFDTIQTHADG